MAKYDVRHRCQHTEVVTLFGPHKERERRLEWLASLPCPDCAAIDRLTSAAAIHELQEAAGLPRLLGTEKQVAWAAQIRQEFLLAWRKIERRLTESALSDEPSAKLAEQLLFEGDAYVTEPLAMAEAKYWIDNRDGATSGSSIERHLFEIRHQIAEEAKAIVGSDLPITDEDKLAVIRLALEQRTANLEARRQAAAEQHAAEIAKRRAEAAAATQAETDKQAAFWARKDADAQAIRTALNNAISAEVKIWWKGNEKRVYLNWGRNSACLYVTGNSRCRPGSFECGGSGVDTVALKTALIALSDYWKNVGFTVTSEGKAK